MAKTLNESSKEVIEDNFLKENPDIPTDQRVVVAQEVPKMEWITFFNNRDPGTTLHFHYHSKTHHLKHYDLVHGQKYHLPIEVIKHLEGLNDHDPYSCHTRIYQRRMRHDGISENYVSGYVSYFQCKPCRA